MIGGGTMGLDIAQTFATKGYTVVIRDITDAIIQDSAELGFVVNKILVPMINEAASLVETGVASVEGIHTAMKPGVNHPMGPLALGAC